MSVITIDIGNTRVKFAVISVGGRVLLSGYLDDLGGGLGEVKGLCDGSLEWEDPIVSIVYSSVKKVNLDWSFWDLQKLNPVEIKELINQLPFQVDIEQPETLGSDRLAGVMGCMYFLKYGKLFREGILNFMMIDAGTCVTYDYVMCGESVGNDGNSADIPIVDGISGGTLKDGAIYYGGAISPGLRLRYQSMSDYTDALPLLEVGMVGSGRLEIGDIGKHTVEAMDSGVMMGFVDEISGRIDRFKEKFVDSQVFLTGGDSEFLGKRLKSGIFVEPMLLHYGLFYADQFKR